MIDSLSLGALRPAPPLRTGGFGRAGSEPGRLSDGNPPVNDGAKEFPIRRRTGDYPGQSGQAINLHCTPGTLCQTLTHHPNQDRMLLSWSLAGFSFFLLAWFLALGVPTWPAVASSQGYQGRRCCCIPQFGQWQWVSRARESPATAYRPYRAWPLGWFLHQEVQFLLLQFRFLRGVSTRGGFVSLESFHPIL